MQKKYFLLFVVFMYGLFGFSQYKISGNIDTNGKVKTIYLSLLQYNEEVAIYPKQILISVKTDDTGYFEIIGKLLPEVNKLYRIHANWEEETEGLEFIEEGKKKNYCNFIFSNTDSIYFPQGEVWFSNPQNTNIADNQWRKAVEYELTLSTEYKETKNVDAISQAEKDFLNEYKQYCTDSLSEPLVKLLAYYRMKSNSSALDEDFKRTPEFYNGLLDELNEYYSGSSYYNQFQEEISKLSFPHFRQKIGFYKKMSLTLAVISLLLVVILLFLYRKLIKERTKNKFNKLSTLTVQEKKVVELICLGKSNKEIADLLFISLSTVKTHIGNINSKLNASNRRELIQKLQNHTGY